MKIIIRGINDKGMGSQEIDVSGALSVEIVINEKTYNVSEVDGTLYLSTGFRLLSVVPVAANAVRVRVE
jgi:hypothetical protein